MEEHYKRLIESYLGATFIGAFIIIIFSALVYGLLRLFFYIGLGSWYALSTIIIIEILVITNLVGRGVYVMIEDYWRKKNEVGSGNIDTLLSRRESYLNRNREGDIEIVTQEKEE